MNIYLQYVRQQHQGWRQDKQSQIVRFESDTITLDLPDSPLVVDNWKIVPMVPPQVVITFINIVY